MFFLLLRFRNPGQTFQSVLEPCSREPLGKFQFGAGRASLSQPFILELCLWSDGCVCNPRKGFKGESEGVPVTVVVVVVK